MKNTIQKQVVLNAVTRMRNHPTAEEVFLEAKKENADIGIATVYRNLHAFAESGAIRQVTVPGASDRFDFRLDAHEHLLCEGCGGIFDVEAAIDIQLKDPCVEITGRTLLLHGICEPCIRCKAQ